MFRRWKACLLVAVIASSVTSAGSPSNSSSPINSSYPIADDDLESDGNLLFTAEQLKQGGVLLFIFGIIYLVSGIIIASNEFFVPSLAVMMDQLKMKEDVAGVTIMTLGIILPTLILGVIGVFIAVPEANISSFVGSSLHNILVVIGFCALLTSEATVIPCWVLVRDWISFLILIVVYILFSLDGSIAIWECVILILFYIAYIICVTTMVKIKPKIEELICKKTPEENIQMEEEQKSSANDTEDTNGSPLTLTRPSGSCPTWFSTSSFSPSSSCSSSPCLTPEILNRASSPSFPSLAVSSGSISSRTSSSCASPQWAVPSASLQNSQASSSLPCLSSSA